LKPAGDFFDLKRRRVGVVHFPESRDEAAGFCRIRQTGRGGNLASREWLVGQEQSCFDTSQPAIASIWVGCNWFGPFTKDAIRQRQPGIRREAVGATTGGGTTH
jgi:hypothetical protein